MQTQAEQVLWEALRNNQVCKLKFRRQHPFDNYILDFYNHKMKLAIEVDGEVHNEPEVDEYDKIRTKNLNENGLTVLRFTNNLVRFSDTGDEACRHRRATVPAPVPAGAPGRSAGFRTALLP